MANLRVRVHFDEPLDFGGNYPVVALYNSPYKDGDCPIASYECSSYETEIQSWVNLNDEATLNASVSSDRADVYDSSGEFDLVEGTSYVVRVYDSGKSAGGSAK